ncbi:MAG: molybdopterin-dependent oxidoreductase [Armatimonadetes bacterium]|nr:molybdopterin-dependent oxidoreductase [Armatimonadota bacterium]
MPETKKTSCLFCSLQCGFAMEMDAGVPVRIDLDTEAQHNLGSLCTRGHYNLELLIHPKRNLAATVNRRRVPWKSAVTKVAGKLNEIRETGGGDALGIIVGTELSNEDYAFATAFARQLGTSNIAAAYDGSDFPLLAGGGAGNAQASDLDDADCFLLVGDVFWGHPCVAKRVIESRYRSRSNRIYTINPYRSNTDWFADRHLQVKPGGEPLVLAGLLNVLNARGVPKVDVDAAAEAAGVSARDLKAIAEGLKEHGKVVVMASLRLGDSTSAYLTGRLSALLSEKMGGRYGPFFRGGNAIGAFNHVGSGRTVPEILEGVSKGKIKGLLVFGPDLLQLYPGAITADQIEKLSLLAASSIFENDTTKHSDVGLPQPVWTEMSGSYSGSIGVATSLEPLTRPQGDARSVSAMLEEIAAEMGMSVTADAGGASHAELPLDLQAELDRLAGQPVSEGVVLIESISPLHRWDGTITGRMSFPRIVSPYCEIWIGEKMAGDLGVDTGMSVALATDRGETSIIATVTDRMPGGLVAIPSYVPDVRGLMTWTRNPATKWFDVKATGAKVTPES